MTSRHQRILRAAHDERGFTLVELLVVMLILALLAAIALATFLSQSDKATDARAKAAVRTAETAIATYATDHDGEYGGAATPALEAIEPTLSDASIAVSLATADAYTLVATSATGNTFTISRNGAGARALTCTVPGEGGCPGSGDWG